MCGPAQPHEDAVLWGRRWRSILASTPHNYLPMISRCLLPLVAAGILAALPASANNSVHVTYHWHLHQPVYWPEVNPFAPQNNRYQFAADSLALKYANSGNFYAGSTYKHPRNALASGDGGEFDSVFDKADRVAAYQGGGRDSINTILAHPDGGASVSYSGALQENIWSLGNANMLGYSPGWNSGYTQARGSSATYRTSGGYPRADMVGQTYHHAFSPLLPKSVLRKEIQIFQEIWWKSWNGNPDQSDHSKGFWPIECAFSQHMIPILAEEGYQWSIIANSHLARTCSNYLEVAQKGNSGWNMDPPNRADQLGPAVPAGQWWSGTLDGRGGAFPAPYAYQAHRAKYVNPSNGVESFITVVPMCDLLSYQNGFSTMGTGDIDAKIAPFNDPARPSLVLMAHDGDNAWGGGNDYYMNSVQNLFNEAAGKGYRPTTIQQFLADHPVPSNAVVHVEDGAWVNAGNDWGHPQFINWLWPPVRPSSSPGYSGTDPRTWFDLETPGWTEDWRNWAVLVAGANYCETAEQITVSTGGVVNIWKIQEPVSRTGVNNNPNHAEQAWHYYLGGLDSGFMYYGTSLDDEVKQTLAVNRAIGFATNIIGNATLDATPPTVFKPQRFPWNPGGKGWGPLTGYQPVGFEGKPPYSCDFHIWTHVFDVGGVTNVTLYIRADNDGVNPIANNDNETYAGGSGVGSWVALPMNQRTLSTGNVPNDPNVNFFLTPQAMADYYWAKVTGYTNVLLDYYISATDSKGNTHQSDIQHVWVDSGVGADSGTSLRVSVLPATPVAGNPVTVHYVATGGPIANANPVKIHLGWNNWATVISPDPSMTFNAASNRWEYTTTVPANTTQLDVVFNNGAGAWDNNGGADWHFAVVPGTPQPPATPTGLAATPVSSNQINLTWSAAAFATGYIVQRGGNPIGTTGSTSYSDTGLAASTAYCYSLIATNSLTNSATSSSVCTNTPATAVVTNFPPFTMDGTLDFAGYRLSSNGIGLYAALRGSKLYVATQSPGNAGPNDHFIFVADQLLPTTTGAAPWSKAGLIAVTNTKPFMATESINDYVVWNNAGAGAQITKSATAGGVLEGVIDLTAAFGGVPANIYLAALAYGTANGGALASQSPAGSGPNVEPNEFFVIPTVALQDQNADGTFDRVDPLLGFVLQGLTVTSSNALLSWNAMPGRSYQVMSAMSPGEGWTDIPGSLTNAGPLQLNLSFDEPFTPSPTQRFYRVKLLP
jgi:hypothetical protein